jgi:RNA 2',3'-cyclic 3'-phosphodiesterase
VAKQRLKSPRARLFIALDLPEGVRSSIVDWGRRELRDPALRPMGTESLHLTLAFLGYLPEKEIERLAGIVAECDVPAPPIELADPVAKPSLSRARVFALPAESPETVALQADLEDRLVAARLYKSEKRPFWPHLTVARVRPESRGSRRPMRVGEAPGPLPACLRRPFGGVRVTLYRSNLRPQGAEYVPLAQVELSEDGQR